jgi:hypothetical protein
LQDIYEILSPDPFLREFMDDYHRLADLYALLRSAYEGKGLTDKELARKTAYLVQAHTQVGVIREAVMLYEINPQTLDRIAQSNQPDTVKVFNLLKSIAQKVNDEAVAAPYLLSIGERAEAIAEAFKQRQIDTQDALKRLKFGARHQRRTARASRTQNFRRTICDLFAAQARGNVSDSGRRCCSKDDAGTGRATTLACQRTASAPSAPRAVSASWK